MSFFSQYGNTISSAAGAAPSGWGQVISAATGYLTQRDQAKADAKAAAQEAQRLFELQKIRTQAEASRNGVMPGAPSVFSGGTGLAPGIPTWALLGAGAALLLFVAMRK